jgi:hypothetical protein
VRTARGLWNAIQCCVNWKVVVAACAVAAVVFVTRPGETGAAVPVLIALICPVSMGVLLWRMRGRPSGPGRMTLSRERSSGLVPSERFDRGPEG